MTTATIHPPAAAARPPARARTRPTALLAGLPGTVMLYRVGCASAPLLHDAAHDRRHSQRFPCH